MQFFSSPSRLAPLAAAAFALALFAAPAAAQEAEMIEGTTLDGASFIAPAQWVVGEPLTVSGQGWVNSAGTTGSVIGVKYDQGTVVPAEPVDEMDDIWLRITASSDGSWSANLPYPDDAGWAAGESHRVHLLTGLLGVNDIARNPVITVTLVAP